MDGSSNFDRTSFRQLETKGSNLAARSLRGPGGKRQNQTLVRLLRRPSLAAHRLGVAPVEDHAVNIFRGRFDLGTSCDNSGRKKLPRAAN